MYPGLVQANWEGNLVILLVIVSGRGVYIVSGRGVY